MCGLTELLATSVDSFTPVDFHRIKTTVQTTEARRGHESKGSGMKFEHYGWR